MKNKSIELRDNGVELINRLRTVRSVISKGRFDQDVFDSINGTDAALESLVGHNISFGMLDSQEVVNLRREILSKLTDNEYEALREMRSSLENYFSDIDSKISGSRSWEAPRALQFLDAKKVAVKLRSASKCGCFSKIALKDVESSFERFTEFLNKVSPLMLSIYTAEQQEGEAAEEEEASAPEIEPNPPETEEVGHQVYTEETEDAITEVIAACKSNISMNACAERFCTTGSALYANGYSELSDVLDALDRISNIHTKYVEALENFRKSVPVDTCPLEDFARNSSRFYSAVEALTNLINIANDVDDKLGAFKDTLLSMTE